MLALKIIPKLDLLIAKKQPFSSSIVSNIGIMVFIFNQLMLIQLFIR